MGIRKPVLNSMERVGIAERAKSLAERTDKVTATNWISGQTCETTPLVEFCIRWIYETCIQLERGTSKVRISDFDRIKYFVLEQDRNAYNVCLD